MAQSNREESAHQLMAPGPWHAYLRPHRSPNIPAAVRLILAGLSGAILAFSFRGSYSSLYSWLCPGLLLSSILGSRPLVAFSCGFLHALLFVVMCVPWIAEVLSVHGGMSLATGWGVLLLIATVWGASIGLFAWAIERLSRRSLTLALLGAPFLWVSTEVLRAYLPEISFPWALLGYPAAGNPALVQLTTVTGIYGMSFIVAAFNALLVWSDCGMAVETKRRLAVVAGVLALLISVQWIGPRFVPRAEAQHLARVLQPDFPENTQFAGDWYTDHKADMVELERLSLRVLPSRELPDLLIWPEAPAPFSLQDPEFSVFITLLSAQFHHPIIAGVIEWKPSIESVNRTTRSGLVPYNSAVMLNETGQRAFSYDKIHLVPFGEYEPFPFIDQVVTSVSKDVGGFRKGKQRSVGRFSNGNMFSVFICYEAIYAGEVREFVHRGAQLLINISNDGWFGSSEAAEQHLRMARVRAVENRRWLIRVTNSGITASIDPYGKMIRVMRRDTRDSTDLRYDFRTDRTIYTRLNDWFAWMCVAVSALLVLLTFRKVR
jgi:apolipoprotein N-acyltransferase